MKVFHVVGQSDCSKFGQNFWPEQISIIYISICRTMTALQHIAKQEVPIMGPKSYTL